MAVVQNTYTGDGVTVLYSLSFPYLDRSDVKVSVNGTIVTNYIFATDTSIQFLAAPGAGASIRIYRDTDNEETKATIFPGSAIKAQDLNANFSQTLYSVQEIAFRALSKFGDTMLGILNMGGFKITNLGTPTSSTDASTKAYVDGVIATGAANAAAAAASASAAAGSASSAAASYDAFDDRYLGSKPTDPALDNDGNALITGAIYFNSTSNVMRVWNGATWQDSSANANVLRWRKTAVGGETSLSGADDNAATLTYTVNLEFVYLNGVLLTRGVDYTASNGTSITGLVALEAGDVVEVLSYSSFSLVNVPGSTIQDGTISTQKFAPGAVVGASFTQAGTGAVARTIDSKLKDVVSVKDFGAVGNGIVDDTTAIQAALDSGARQISGDGLTYVVTTIYPRSTQIISDMRLIRKGSVTQVFMQPVIKIGGTGSTVSNVTLINIIINGNRQNLSNIYVGAGEDGGMHGFKIAEGSSNIRLINCEASYCGTAGLAIHPDLSSNTADYPIRNIYIENFSATYNREHGMFGDSFDGVYVNGGIFNNNGRTLAGGFPNEHGNTGFIHGGNLFGSGFDLECYVGYAQTYFKNFYASDLVCTGNSTPCMIYAPPAVNAVAEIPALNIHLKNVHFERGSNAGTINAFEITANSPVGEKYGVDQVSISGYLDGIVNANGARRLTFVDGFIRAADGITRKALINNCKDVAITAPSNRSHARFETLGSLSTTTNTGVGTLTIGYDQLVKSNGRHSLILTFSIGGGLISGGPMSWTITLPTTTKAMTGSSPTVNAYNSISGTAVRSSCVVLSENTIRIFVFPIDDVVYGTLELEVLI